MELLGRMSVAMQKGHAPEEFQSKKVRTAIDNTLSHAKAHVGVPKAPQRKKAGAKKKKAAKKK
jgi:hypothetical protein